MKRFLITLLFLLTLPLSASAANGDIIGSIYSTDIIAEVNGRYIDSFNINGKTAIILEDLKNYGAEVFYNDELRTLIVNTNAMCNDYSVTVRRGTPGEIAGNIYESDIVVYLNGERINSFALNGTMAAAIEDIANDGAYSKCNGMYLWNESDRKISLSVMTDNSDEIISQLAEKNYGGEIKISGDELSIDVSAIKTGVYSMPIVPEEEKYLCYNGEIVARVYKRTAAYFDNNEIKFADGNCIFFDRDKMLEIIDGIEAAQTYEDVMNYINEAFLPIGTVFARQDADDWTFIYCSVTLRDGSYDHILRIGRDGSFVDYTDGLPDFLQVKKVDNAVLDKENGKFFFDYDGTQGGYEIDLNTGIMTEVLK